MSLFRNLIGEIEQFYATQKAALMLTGARQTGKTYAIREFGRRFESFIEINFISSPEAIGLFENVSSAEDVLLRISAFSDKPLIKGNTLIFFDEIQECENIVTAIKFLVDEGSYRYALSGSLWGVELNDTRSIPVGYMDIKEVFPLDFKEFLINVGVSQSVLDHVQKSWDELRPVDEFIHSRLLDLFRLYVIVGGMPAVVAKYIETNDMNIVSQTQQLIINLYKADISKYAKEYKLKIREIFDLIPSELDAKNKRFILKRLNEHAKFSRYQNDFLWLKNAGVAIPVYNVEVPIMPLKLAESRNLFKLFSNDVGLLSCQYAGGIQVKILSGELNVNFGAVYENVVAQELVCHGISPYFYNSKRFGELDFVIAEGKNVVPIEVKSGKDYERHNAFRNVMESKEFAIQRGYVLCQGNVRVDNKVIYLPIYMTMFLKKQATNLGKYTIDLTGLQ